MGIILWAVAFASVFDALFEIPLVHGHVVAYPNTISWLTLFNGTSHQWPVYEGFVWGAICWAPFMVMRFYRDDRGHSIVERGVDQLRISYKTKVILQILAVAAATNISYVLQDAVYSWIGFQLDQDNSALYPSYTINGICGDKTPNPCPVKGRPLSTGGAPGSPSSIPGDGRTWVDIYLGR